MFRPFNLRRFGKDEGAKICGLKTKPAMQEQKDIQNKEDVKRFVDAFYAKVKCDALLSPVFAAKIPADAWPSHLQRIYAFWKAILFAETGFDGNPMQKHFSLPVAEEHFDRWVSLFTQTIDEDFSGPRAEEAKKRAASIARLMYLKLQQQRQ